MRHSLNRKVSTWILALVLPGLAACGAKPGSQPKKVGTEVGQAAPVTPPGPGPSPGPGPGPGMGGNPAAIGVASQKVLVFHLSKSAEMKPGDAPDLELRIIPLQLGRVKVTLAEFSNQSRGYEEQDFQLIASANHEEINTDRLEAIDHDGKKLIPIGSIRFDGKKSGQLESGKIWIDFQGADSRIQAEYFYVLSEIIQPLPAPGASDRTGAPGPGNGGPSRPPVQGGGSNLEQPPVTEVLPRVLPIRGVMGQPVKFYPLVQNLGSRVCKAKLMIEPTAEASQYLLTLESELCGGFELNSMKAVPVKLVSSANSTNVNQDSLVSVDGQWKIEFQGSGFEYVFGSGPNGTGAFDQETGTIQLNGVKYTYDTGRVLKRGQFPH